MSRGRLRTFLGAAPGVGTTFAMLQEGHRLRGEGRDVVIGVVDDHGRHDTAALLAGLEVVPGHRHSVGSNHEMDLDAVIARGPDVVLVDELAHTNASGSRHERRWQDVQALVDLGIDVVSTLDIQHLESLTDVIHEITGVTPKDTIPDGVVRASDEIELVDVTEEGIRRRLAAGRIYPAESIDVALANYFRPGNLAALRELALQWTADRVEESLSEYRSVHGIDEAWETKERLVVWMTGAPGAEAVIRRAGRLALRARAELVGVFVRPTRLLTESAHSDLAEQRLLLSRLGGRYHEIVGDDEADSLLSFAETEQATQLVVGVFGGSRFDTWLKEPTVARLLRKSGSIDIHVVPSDETDGATVRQRPGRPRQRIGGRRRQVAWAATLVGLPLLTWVLLHGLQATALHIILFIYLLAAVIVAAIGGVGPAVTSAGIGFVLANWYFTPPVRTWSIAHVDDLFSLFTFLVVSLVVGLLVGVATRKSAEAHRARAQAEALAAISAPGHPGPGSGLESLVGRIREAFALSAAAILRRSDGGWETLAAVGEIDLSTPESGSESIRLTDDMMIVLSDGRLTADDRRVLRAFAAQATQALELAQLAREAQAAEAMAETDRLRTALLRAVSHDLRTPLAAIKASVTSLLETGIDWTTEETFAFLATILTETERLNRLVGRLLDASRVQSGAVPVVLRDIEVEEVVSAAVAGAGAGRERVVVEIPETLPPIRTDAALLERVVANLVENALTWSPPDALVRVTAGEIGGHVDLRIIDRGPGIPPDQRERIFQPFQRLGDSAVGEGVGLGLTVVKGFLEAMGNDLTVEDTSGGGTTIAITLEIAAETSRDVASTKALP